MYNRREGTGLARSSSRCRQEVGSQSSESQSTFVKCVVVGDGQVGKTCLLVRYCTDRFQGQFDSYQPTIFENYQHTMEHEETRVRLLLFDTAGQEDYDRVRQLIYPQTDVFILCFSPFLASSFYNVEQRWLPELRKSCPDVPIVLVATQSDYRGRPDIFHELQRDGEEIISTERGTQMAQQIGATRYLECSALTREGLDGVFHEAVESVLRPGNNRSLAQNLSSQKTTGCNFSKIFGCCIR